MTVLSTKGFEDYELIDSGSKMRLERFGKYIISKPDPQAIWKPSESSAKWKEADAIFDSGKWNYKAGFPNKWELNFSNIKFFAKLTPFKHTGVFPEQSINWKFIEEKVKKSDSQPNILNLFAYTGIASLVAAANGAKVTHLDASKSSISWVKDNQNLSALSDKPIRYILDDALDFTAREARRGVLYDAIIMDPPVYGHGPNNEIWDFDKSFPILLENCFKILSKTPLFVIINAYALSSSSLMIKNMLEDYLNAKNIEFGELALEQRNGRLLSTGIFARYPQI